jgi:hypothetical protein
MIFLHATISIILTNNWIRAGCLVNCVGEGIDRTSMNDVAKLYTIAQGEEEE